MLLFYDITSQICKTYIRMQWLGHFLCCQMNGKRFTDAHIKSSKLMSRKFLSYCFQKTSDQIKTIVSNIVFFYVSFCEKTCFVWNCQNHRILNIPSVHFRTFVAANILRWGALFNSTNRFCYIFLFKLLRNCYLHAAFYVNLFPSSAS